MNNYTMPHTMFRVGTRACPRLFFCYACVPVLEGKYLGLFNIISPKWTDMSNFLKPAVCG